MLRRTTSSLAKRKQSTLPKLSETLTMSTKEFLSALVDAEVFAYEQQSAIRPLGLTPAQIKALQSAIEEHNALPGVADILIGFDAEVKYRDKTPYACLLVSLHCNDKDTLDSDGITDLIQTLEPFLISRDGAKKLREAINALGDTKQDEKRAKVESPPIDQERAETSNAPPTETE